MFDKLFGWNKASVCKDLLKTIVSRVKLLRNKRQILIKHLQQDISQLLKNGHYESSFARVDLLFKEQNMVECYDIVEQYCECVLKQLPYIRKHKDRPGNIEEALSSLIFASARCGDLPELQRLRKILAKRYGQEYVFAAVELLPNSAINPKLIEKLTVRAPTYDTKLKLMTDIVQHLNLRLDSSIESKFRNPKKNSSLQQEIAGSKNMNAKVDVPALKYSCNNDGSNEKEADHQRLTTSISSASSSSSSTTVKASEKAFDRDITVVSGSVREVPTISCRNRNIQNLDFLPSKDVEIIKACNASSGVEHHKAVAGNDKSKNASEHECKCVEPSRYGVAVEPRMMQLNGSSLLTVSTMEDDYCQSRVAYEAPEEAMEITETIPSSSSSSFSTHSWKPAVHNRMSSNQQLHSPEDSSVEEEKCHANYRASHKVDSVSESTSDVFNVSNKLKWRGSNVHNTKLDLERYPKSHMYETKRVRRAAAKTIEESSSEDDCSEREFSAHLSHKDVQARAVKSNGQGKGNINCIKWPLREAEASYLNESDEDAVGLNLHCRFPSGKPRAESRRRCRSAIDSVTERLVHMNRVTGQPRSMRTPTFSPGSWEGRANDSRELRKSHFAAQRHSNEEKRHSVHAKSKESLSYFSDGNSCSSEEDESTSTDSQSEMMHKRGKAQIRQKGSDSSRNFTSTNATRQKCSVRSKERQRCISLSNDIPTQREDIQEFSKPGSKSISEETNFGGRHKFKQFCDDYIQFNVPSYRPPVKEEQFPCTRRSTTTTRIHHQPMDSTDVLLCELPGTMDASSSSLSRNTRSKSNNRAAIKQQRARNRARHISLDMDEEGQGDADDDHFPISTSDLRSLRSFRRRQRSSYFQRESSIAEDDGEGVCISPKLRRRSIGTEFEYHKQNKYLHQNLDTAEAEATATSQQYRKTHCTSSSPKMTNLPQCRKGGRSSQQQPNIDLQVSETKSNRQAIAAPLAGMHKIFEADYAHIKTKNYSNASTTARGADMDSMFYSVENSDVGKGKQSQNVNRNSNAKSSAAAMANIKIDESENEAEAAAVNNNAHMSQRTLSLPPLERSTCFSRSSSAMRARKKRSESLKSDITDTESSSILQSPRTPGVHPKLPDYDDLAAKFTALKHKNHSHRRCISGFE